MTESNDTSTATKRVKPSPGPWTFEPGDKGDPSVGIAPTEPTVFCGNPNGEGDGVLLATLHEPIYQNDEDGYPLYFGHADANGRLIAASPKLVGALSVDDIDQIVEAIENFVMGPMFNPVLNQIWQPYIDKLRALRAAIEEAGGQ